MTTVIVDDDVRWQWSEPVPGFVPPTIAERLAKGFDSQAEFILYEGEPYVVWGNWDYAECWAHGKVREVHPFLPYFKGTKITAAAFRAMLVFTQAPTWDERCH